MKKGSKMRNLTVWIIEDDSMEADRVETLLKQIEDQQDTFTFTLQSSRSLDWPPIFNKNSVPDSSLQLPDIVILDLFQDEITLKGDGFYKALRATEQKYKAFIIIWSGYTSDRAAEYFIKDVEYKDGRIGILECKDIFLLEDIVKGILDRILEEE